jgi:hypothetical protein
MAETARLHETALLVVGRLLAGWIPEGGRWWRNSGRTSEPISESEQACLDVARDTAGSATPQEDTDG